MSSRAATSSGRKRIVVLGYIVRGPIGGMAWHHLNYILGLHALGHDVLFVEDSDDYESCYDPSQLAMVTDPTYGLAFAERTFDRVGLPDRWCYFDAHTNQWHGPAARTAIDFCRSADVMLNVSGVNPLREWTANIPVRTLIDTDPVFTQIRHLNEPARLDYARMHNRFMTFGEAIPAGTSRVPDDGLPWRATRQPVSLEHWPVAPPVPTGPITTVMQWDSYKTQSHDGVTYGMKSRSFDDYLDLPARTGEALRLAIGGGPPREKLASHGWQLDDPLAVTRDPWTYQQYIHNAAAEWTVAKHGYVAGRSGWFSERSACFLASGRPVIVQDTHFGDFLPTGKGLLAFDSPASAAEAIHAVRCDYATHCRAARRIAESHFDSHIVLRELLDKIDRAPSDQLAATPSPFQGEGWGEGETLAHGNSHDSTPSLSLSPTRGRGAGHHTPSVRGGLG